MSRVWLVTGANSGFGRAITEAAVGTGTQPGDPAKAAAAILAALDAEQTPLHLPLGDDAVDAILGQFDSVRADITTWEKVARDTALQP